MANNKGAIIFLAILAIAGLGLSGYMFVNDTFLGGDDHTHETEGLKLVALWEDLDENLVNNPLYTTVSNFLIEYEDQIVLETNYVNVINSTRFSLIVPGLYKINLAVVFGGILDVDSTFWVYLMENNTEKAYFERFSTGNPVIDIFYYAKGSLYINATSAENYYEIRAWTGAASGFRVATDSGSPYFNQLSIEYVLG
ncbi:MAG: hypothetical protein JW776_13405 [Candidatus Lokiarchaeota archaeon]|nr:hypothetical protein [Candidatus Lokiarchaeota archaeon]